jgi:hypothetical protein
MAVGWVRGFNVFKAHLLDYIVFYLTLTTENCFKQLTRLWGRLKGKNGIDASPREPIHQAFFRCNISPKGALF